MFKNSGFFTAARRVLHDTQLERRGYRKHARHFNFNVTLREHARHHKPLSLRRLHKSKNHCNHRTDNTRVFGTDAC